MLGRASVGRWLLLGALAAPLAGCDEGNMGGTKTGTGTSAPAPPVVAPAPAPSPEPPKAEGLTRPDPVTPPDATASPK